MASPLLPKDYIMLAQSWITSDIADLARLFRVNSEEGAELIGGRARRDYSGIVFPYYWPGDTKPRDYRLRRDNPEIIRDGTIEKIKNKYLSPPGDRNKLYFTPQIEERAFTDSSISLIITEGEKKALSLYRLAREFSLPWVVVGISGVWNWRGVIGKTTNSNGARQDVKGPISDFDKFELSGRTVYLVFDANAQTNSSVGAAQYHLARFFAQRGARPIEVKIPLEANLNGIDDLLAQPEWGPSRVLELFNTAQPLTKPRIAINRQLSEILPDACDAIRAWNNPPSLFIWSHQFVKLVYGANKMQMQLMDKDLTNGILFRCADWVSVSEESIRPARPPRDIVADIVSSPPADLPELLAVVNSPVFAPSGELISTPGYHPEAKLYISGQCCSVPPVSLNPTSSEIDSALELINELLEDFPFTEPSDRVNAISTILEQFVRFMIPGLRPLRAIDAATPGTGKGLLAAVIQHVCFGLESAATAAPHDKSEWAKVITALLSSAPDVVFFDNVRHAIDSAELELALTIPTWEGRILGESRKTHLSTNVLWLITGNNLRFNGELARRVVRIRIVANVEKPWERKDFRHPDLLGWVIKNRGRLIHAALTLCQSWISAGAPQGSARLGSFDAWASTMSGLLEHLGIPGFLANMEKLYEESDPARHSWSEFIKHWWDSFGDLRVTVSMLNDMCDSHDLLNEMRGDRGPKSQQSILGRLLRKHRDQIFHFKKLIFSVGTDSSGSGNRTFYQLQDIAKDIMNG